MKRYHGEHSGPQWAAAAPRIKGQSTEPIMPTNQPTNQPRSHQERLADEMLEALRELAELLMPA